MNVGVVHLKNFVDDPATGRPAIVCGYAALYGVVSETKFERGLPEVLAPNAFDAFLEEDRSPYLKLNHSGLMALPDDVTIWSDEVGLAFQARNIKMTAENARAIRQIAAGILSGCSWKHVPAQSIRNIEEVEDGRTMHVVRSVGCLEEIGPCVQPAYAETAVWLSSTSPERTKHYRLALQWQQSARAFVGR